MYIYIYMRRSYITAFCFFFSCTNTIAYILIFYVPGMICMIDLNVMLYLHGVLSFYFYFFVCSACRCSTGRPRGKQGPLTTTGRLPGWRAPQEINKWGQVLLARTNLISFVALYVCVCMYYEFCCCWCFMFCSLILSCFLHMHVEYVQLFVCCRHGTRFRVVSVYHYSVFIFLFFFIIYLFLLHMILCCFLSFFYRCYLFIFSCFASCHVGLAGGTSAEVGEAQPCGAPRNPQLLADSAHVSSGRVS